SADNAASEGGSQPVPWAESLRPDASPASAAGAQHGADPARGPAPTAGPATSGVGGVSAETPESPERDSPEAASLADALAGIAADYLAGKITAADNPDIYQVVIHVGPEALNSPDADPGPETEPVGVSAETPAADGQPGGDSAEVEEACRPDCPYRHVGHPAHPRRCHLEDGPALSPATAQRI